MTTEELATNESKESSAEECIETADLNFEGSVWGLEDEIKSGIDSLFGKDGSQPNKNKASDIWKKMAVECDNPNPYLESMYYGDLEV